jgi:hypothetical protein
MVWIMVVFQGELEIRLTRELLRTKFFVMRSENGSSFYLMKSSILAMDCLNIPPTITIPYKSIMRPALTPTI